MVTSTNCFQAKTGQLHAQWYVIDAGGQVVGRLAAQIAPILMGKHRPTYTPYIDTGDYVIVTNVDKVVFTGKKWQQKTYQRYSGYPGGQRDEPAGKLFARKPERILELAIRRMMPKNKIGRHMMSKLKLYVGPNHPHQAQAPIPLEAINGRPAAAGAIYIPEPKPKTPRPEPGPAASAEPEPSPLAIPQAEAPAQPQELAPQAEAPAQPRELAPQAEAPAQPRELAPQAEAPAQPQESPPSAE